MNNIENIITLIIYILIYINSVKILISSENNIKILILKIVFFGIGFALAYIEGIAIKTINKNLFEKMFSLAWKFLIVASIYFSLQILIK